MGKALRLTLRNEHDQQVLLHDFEHLNRHTGRLDKICHRFELPRFSSIIDDTEQALLQMDDEDLDESAYLAEHQPWVAIETQRTAFRVLRDHLPEDWDDLVEVQEEFDRLIDELDGVADYDECNLKLVRR